MVVSTELHAQILRYYHVEKWRRGTIARQLGVHRDVVARVLAQAGLPAHGPAQRPTRIDPIWGVPLSRNELSARSRRLPRQQTSAFARSRAKSPVERAEGSSERSPNAHVLSCRRPCDNFLHVSSGYPRYS